MHTHSHVHSRTQGYLVRFLQQQLVEELHLGLPDGALHYIACACVLLAMKALSSALHFVQGSAMHREHWWVARS